MILVNEQFKLDLVINQEKYFVGYISSFKDGQVVGFRIAEIFGFYDNSFVMDSMLSHWKIHCFMGINYEISEKLLEELVLVVKKNTKYTEPGYFRLQGVDWVTGKTKLIGSIASDE